MLGAIIAMASLIGVVTVSIVLIGEGAIGQAIKYFKENF